MDLEMPIMDGYEATVKIRESEKENGYPRTFICGLSAYTDESMMFFYRPLVKNLCVEVKQRCIECGMDNYLSKPLNMEQMMQMIGQEFGKMRVKK